jgi:hypothetical protein
MAVAKNTLLAVLLIALNNNVAAFMPAASTRVSYQYSPWGRTFSKKNYVFSST